MYYNNSLTSHVSYEQLKGLYILQKHFEKVYLVSSINQCNNFFNGHRTKDGGSCGITIAEQEAYIIPFNGHTYVVAITANAMFRTKWLPVFYVSEVDSQLAYHGDDLFKLTSEEEIRFSSFYIREVDGQLAYHDDDLSKPASEEVKVLEEELIKIDSLLKNGK